MRAVFRCDATVSIGFGHLSRCIALAEALRLSGVRSTFAGLYDTAAKEQIVAADFDVVDCAKPVNTEAAERELAGIEASFVVIDSYRIDEIYLSGLKSMGLAVVVIDDFCKLADYPCDVVLNFTWEAPELGYPQGPSFILGHKNLLARRKLVERRQKSNERDRDGKVRNLLVAIGGSDPKGLTLRIVRLLNRHDLDLCVHAITNENPELESELKRFGAGSCIVLRQPDLSQQLVWADAAITGGGLIKYESAFMGVPAAAIAQNEGQDGETKVFSRAGLVFDLGLADSVTDDELAEALHTFCSDADLRANMTKQMHGSFPADPSANAATSILEALRR